MGILFCGGELEDFQTVGSVAVSTTVGYFRSAYSRMAVNADGGAWGVNYIRAPFAAGSTVGVTGRIYIPASAISSGAVFLWLASAGSARLRLKVNSASPATLTLESYTAGGVATTLATSTNTIATSYSYRFDLLVSYGASGRARLWVDGVLYLDTGTMDITASGSTTLDSANFGNTRTSTTTAPWSEIIIADEDTRPLSLKTLVPNAAGDTNAWTGAYTDIDEAAASDTDVVSSATAGQVMNMDVTGMPAGSSGLSVRAVKVVASALRGASGPSKLALGVKSGATEGWSTDIPLDTGYTTVSNTWTVNPATGQAFTSTELEALKIALKSVA